MEKELLRKSANPLELLKPRNQRLLLRGACQRSVVGSKIEMVLYLVLSVDRLALRMETL